MYRIEDITDDKIYGTIINLGNDFEIKKHTFKYDVWEHIRKECFESFNCVTFYNLEQLINRYTKSIKELKTLYTDLINHTISN